MISKTLSFSKAEVPSLISPSDLSTGLPQVAAVESDLSTSAIFKPRVFLDLHLGHDRNPQIIRALYDTGAVTSLMSSDDFRKCQEAGCVVGEVEPEQSFQLKGANQLAIDNFGVYAITFTVLGRICDAPFIVSRSVSPTIIGMNVIGPFGIFHNPVTMELYILCHGSQEGLIKLVPKK